MDIKTIEKNLDYISMNYQFSKNGNPELARFLKDEMTSQIVTDTTLAHNRWESVVGRRNILRSTGGFSLLSYSNKIILQASGEAFLYLDEFDVKDIFTRAIFSIQKSRRFDIEKIYDEPSISIGRLDSQITIAINANDVDEFFSIKDFHSSGQFREFRRIIDGKSVFTGRNWIKNRESNLYLMTPEELKKCPQLEIKKRDFMRIYDKPLEIIETTLPFSDKRRLLIDKYAPFINAEDRIFRIEVQEMDRGLTKHQGMLLDEQKTTFKDIAHQRLESFAKRNPFNGMWEALLNGAVRTPF